MAQHKSTRTIQLLCRNAMMRRLFGNERSCEISQMQMQVVAGKEKATHEFGVAGDPDRAFVGPRSIVVRLRSKRKPAPSATCWKISGDSGKSGCRATTPCVHADYVHGLGVLGSAGRSSCQTPAQVSIVPFSSDDDSSDLHCLRGPSPMQQAVSPPPASSPKTTRILISLIDQSYRGGGRGGEGGRGGCLKSSVSGVRQTNGGRRRRLTA